MHLVMCIAETMTANKNSNTNSPIKRLQSAINKQAQNIQSQVEGMDFKYHGNWCGPNEPKTGQNPPAIDALDRACRRHDRSYERGFISGADKQFVRDTAIIPTVKAQAARAGFTMKLAAGLSKDHSKELVVYDAPMGKEVAIYQPALKRANSVALYRKSDSPAKTTPPLELVGVEPNPGPYFGPKTKAATERATIQVKYGRVNPKKKAKAKNKRASRRATLTVNNIQNFNSDSKKEDVADIPFDEYITDISGTTGAALTTNGPYWVNPGQALTFPVLSKEAANWQRWRMSSDLTITYKREVSEYATNGTTGKVLLSYLDDPKANIPGTKQAIESTDYHSDGMPSEFVKLVIPAKIINAGRATRFIRPGNLPGSASIDDYDGGKFFLCTYGNVNTTVIGEVRISGRVKLYDRILTTSVAQTIIQDSWFQSSGAETLVSNTPHNLLLANNVAVFASNPLNGLNIVNTGGLLVPPTGNYRIQAACLVTAGTDITSAYLYITKNTLDQTWGQNFASPAANLITQCALNDHAIVSCNGTDVISLSIAATGTGVLSAYGDIFFTAC